MLCTATLIVISLSARSANVHCTNGQVITRSAIIGATNTPTPTGKFKVYYADDASGYGYNKQYAAFKKHPNGSEYALHANSPELNQSGSMGCVRFDQADIRVNVGAIVNITK